MTIKTKAPGVIRVATVLATRSLSAATQAPAATSTGATNVAAIPNVRVHPYVRHVPRPCDGGPSRVCGTGPASGGTPRRWGNSVRDAFPGYRGPWPRMAGMAGMAAEALRFFGLNDGTPPSPPPPVDDRQVTDEINTIGPNDSVNVGLQATHPGDTATPAPFALNGITCATNETAGRRHGLTAAPAVHPRVPRPERSSR